MKKFIFNTIILATLLLSSCNKNKNEEDIVKDKQNLPTALSYLSALSTPVNAQFIFESSSSMFVNPNSQPTVIGTVIDDNGELTNIGDININNFTITPVNKIYGANFLFPYNMYGERVIVKANQVTSPYVSGYDFKDTVYIPQRLQIDQTDLNHEINLNTVTTGKIIRWSQDNLNISGGVVVVVEYQPLNAANSVISQTFPTYIRNGIVVPDNGQYTFDNTILKDMPHGASLLITFARISYKIGVTSANKSYLISANNQKYLNFKYP